MDEQIVVYLYNEILLSNNREQVTEIANNMEKSQNHFASERRWNKNNFKYILSDSIAVKLYKNKSNSFLESNLESNLIRK